MINFVEVENNIDKNKIDNCYIMVGFNEELIKKTIKKIKDKIISNNFQELNYFEFDGNETKAEPVINACETLPFMSEKKMVVVYRAVFLEDKGKQLEVDAKKTYEALVKYVDKIPSHCVLIMYYVFKEKRDKVSKKVRSISKKCTVVEFNLLRGALLEKQVRAIFAENKKNIGKVELSLFCRTVENNLDIIKQEVEKLCCYTYNREITKEDIFDMLPYKNDNDIFDMVDYISQRKPQKSLNILNELIYRGEKDTHILSMIERQFKLLLSIKDFIKDRKNKEIIAKELKLNSYICEKMMHQSTKFTENQLRRCLESCINTERIIKSVSANSKTQLELLIIKNAIVK